MSVGAILTLGYGTFGGVSPVITLGFLSGEAAEAATAPLLYLVSATGRNGRTLRRKKLSAKDPEEAVVVTFDYQLDLAAGETLSSAAVGATVLVGTDASPAAIISGAATVSGETIKQLVIGGIAGNNYRLQCEAVTSLGQELVLAGNLPVRES